MVVLLGETGGMNDGSFGIKVPFFRTGRGASGHGSGRSDGGDRVLVVGAAVLRPQDRAGAGRGAAVTVQGGAGAPVDDVVAAVATGSRRHCWLLPPFHGACMQVAPLAVLPQLSATIPLVLLTMRYHPLPSGTNCHCRLVLPSQRHCWRLHPDGPLPPLSSTRPLVTLATLTQPVGTGAAFRVGIWPEKVSLTT